MKAIHLFKNGASVLYEKLNGWYCIRLCNPAGDAIDKVRCDSYRDAQAYYKAFKAIARAM